MIRVDFYNKAKRSNSLMFTQELKEVQIVNKHY